MNQLYSEIFENPFTLNLGEIPVMEYDLFSEQLSGMLKDEAKHCVAYYGIKFPGFIKLICCIANDNSGSVRVFTTRITHEKISLKSLASVCPQLHMFEREIHENFGVNFEGHPWLKPVRYPHNRADKNAIMDNYPFYEIESEELHEVGVGPIHAGVIEPGQVTREKALSTGSVGMAARTCGVKRDTRVTEGWRGEICHSAITDGSGRIIHYKVKYPSFHIWMALALAVRNQEISDFPVCNKSFNLSYCGNDL